MKTEFSRYRLNRFRIMTGALQIFASIGLLVGLEHQWLGFLAATGLSIQMAFALGVRLRIRDSLIQCLPAAFYLLTCGWLSFILF